MSADLYQRPSREQIAARVNAAKSPGPLTCFAIHLRARMRALGWEQADLQEHAAISAHVAGRVLNGSFCDLGLAAKIAVLVGRPLTTMISAYRCGNCDGTPPPGFTCQECGTEGPRSREDAERREGRERLDRATAEATRRPA